MNARRKFKIKGKNKFKNLQKKFLTFAENLNKCAKISKRRRRKNVKFEEATFLILKLN